MQAGQTGAKSIAESDGCPTSHIYIPNLSPDGISPLPITSDQKEAFISHLCGGAFGLDESPVAIALVEILSLQLQIPL